MSDEITRAIGRVIWVGLRGAEPGDGVLDEELDRCEAAGAGGVILFDVDVPERQRLMATGLTREAASALAPRNIRSPEQAAALCAHIRGRLGENTAIVVDQEGGRVCRLGERYGFPPAPSARDVGEMDDAARADAAERIARAVAMAGIDLNLAPCVDVAVNPDGPGHTAAGRSFGRDPSLVTRCAAEQITAMHAAGVGACLKHFPGHGSAEGDTHEGMVDITRTWLRDEELAPYRALCGLPVGDAARPDAVMISHLVHRGLDADLPCSVSASVMTGLLRVELAWDGLIMTDSLDMRAIADRFGAGEATVMALAAGADVALEANNLIETKPCPAPEMRRSIEAALADGRLTADRVAEASRRIDAMIDGLRRSRSAGASA